MKTKRLIFPAILILYGLLYIATTRTTRCDDKCMKYYGIDTMLRKNRDYIVYSYACRDTSFCVFVKDSVARNWPALADTACTYLQAVSLPSTRIIITSTITGDTLASQRCP
jgi:hypothetical protein